MAPYEVEINNLEVYHAEFKTTEDPSLGRIASAGLTSNETSQGVRRFAAAGAYLYGRWGQVQSSAEWQVPNSPIPTGDGERSLIVSPKSAVQLRADLPGLIGFSIERWLEEFSAYLLCDWEAARLSGADREGAPLHHGASSSLAPKADKELRSEMQKMTDAPTKFRYKFNWRKTLRVLKGVDENVLEFPAALFSYEDQVDPHRGMRKDEAKDEQND